MKVVEFGDIFIVLFDIILTFCFEIIFTFYFEIILTVWMDYIFTTARFRHINSPADGTLSSYGHIICLLHFLQVLTVMHCSRTFFTNCTCTLFAEIHCTRSFFTDTHCSHTRNTLYWHFLWLNDCTDRLIL